METLDAKIAAIEERMREVPSQSPKVELLQTLHGVRFILVTVIALEVVNVRRFPSPKQFEASGLLCGDSVPPVQASRVRFATGRCGTMWTGT